MQAGVEVCNILLSFYDLICTNLQNFLWSYYYCFLWNFKKKYIHKKIQKKMTFPLVYNNVWLSDCTPMKNWIQVMLHYFWTTLYFLPVLLVYMFLREQYGSNNLVFKSVPFLSTTKGRIINCIFQTACQVLLT